MPTNQRNKLSLWTKLKQRLAKTTDSEPEQAIKIRLTIGLAVVIYFSFPWHQNETFADTFFSIPSIITLSYFVGALLIVSAILINPTSSPVRRVVGIFLDLVSLSILTFFAGSESVFMFVLYLWIILGNGFRYGTNYLYISMIVGLLGFSSAITWGEYWQDAHYQSIAISLLLILVLVPAYSAFLINKLHAAIASAKDANEAKSRFLANMSHELRTPLNGVIGMADLMGETELNRQQYEFINILRGSANSLLGLIENVLDISKIEAGKITIKSEQFDLHLLVNGIIKIQSPMGAAKKLQLCCHIDSSTPFLLEGDQQHLRQVLVNLIGNAIKFTNEGVIKVFIFPVDTSLENPVIRFEIQDTGIGLSEDEMVTIFDDFTQVNASNNNSTGGTGLGTTISKELVQLMGGEIGVESIKGEGTTFWFELPFNAIQNETPPLSDKHILLLTTDEAAEDLSPALSSWGVTYDLAKSSARAFLLLMQAIDDDNSYKIMLVEQSCIADIEPVKFAQMIQTEPALQQLSLVLINSSESDSYDSTIQQFYISAIHDLNDKRLLFNAIHAAQSVNIDDEKIVTLAEHFSKQAKVKSLNILIAEDNSVNQQVLEGVLLQAGHKCSIVEDGEQALDVLAEKIDSIDMLILDMNLPELSGIEVAKAMQYMGLERKIPIIMLTADATPEAKENCLNAGADVFLTKPLQSKILLNQIASLSTMSAEHSESNEASKEPQVNSWFEQATIDELAKLGDGEQFIHQLIKGFKSDGLKHLTSLKQSASEDYLEYRAGLHALKGSAKELGATKLAELCHVAETFKPYDINTTKVHEITIQIESTFSQTVSALEESVSTNSQGKNVSE